MREHFVDRVFDSMMGNHSEEERIPEVEDAFADGNPCELWYADIIETYQGICDKMGVSDEPDVARIMISFQKISKELCYRMYEYGARFGREEETPCG